MNRGGASDRRAARDARWLWPATLLAAALLVTAFMLKLALGFTGTPDLSKSLSLAVLVMVAVAMFRLFYFIGRMWWAGIDRPIRELRSNLKSGLQSQLVIVSGIAIIAATLFAMTFLKSMIAAVAPFWADPVLHRTDQWLHVDPAGLARLFSPWMGPIGIFYSYWHLVNLLGIIWVIHWRDEGRGRFVLSYMLTWSIGMACAYAFASAGPIFTGTYPKTLAPPSVAMAVDYLLTNYRSHSAMIGGGISAFPSLHVAIAAWFALVLAHRGWCWVGITYAAAVWACSVILGWHYLADGLAGILIALLADHLARRIVRERPSKSAI